MRLTFLRQPTTCFIFRAHLDHTPDFRESAIFDTSKVKDLFLGSWYEKQ